MGDRATVSADVQSNAHPVSQAEDQGTSILSYQWRRNFGDLPGETSPTLHLENVDGTDAGSYEVVVTDSTGQATSETATLNVSPEVLSALTNLSNRSLVLTGSEVMIPGFVITGTVRRPC